MAVPQSKPQAKRAHVQSDTHWQVPAHRELVLQPKRLDYCVVIPVINEGTRIQEQLTRMRAAQVSAVADIIIADGGSTDGSLDSEFLAAQGVTACLTKEGPGKIGAQLRMGYAWAMRMGYKGVVTIDGNGKDGVEAIADFVAALQGGLDFVQGSRFVPGGHAVRTPWMRHWAIRLVHAPLLSRAAGHVWTDTTNGFRAYSRKLITCPRLGLFRDVLSSYELLFYISARAPRLGYACCEMPVSRTYPARGKAPTKISPIRGNLKVMRELIRVARGAYNPAEDMNSD